MNSLENADSTTVGQTADNRIRKVETRGTLKVRKVSKSDYQKEDSLTAEIEQTVETKGFYPTKSVSNNMQDNIFDTKAFGYAEKEFTNKETRVSFLVVPENMKVEDVQKQLESFPAATNYKVMSNRPILTDDQIYATEQTPPLTTKAAIANKQAVRYPEGHEKAGQLILDPNGKVQYRQIFFSATAKEDMDLRTADASDYFVSEELKAEVEATGQVKL